MNRDSPSSRAARNEAAPIARYSEIKADQGWRDDPAQDEAVGYLQALYERLLESPPSYGRFERVRFRLRPRKASLTPVRGLYIWGGVGRGKTFLVDLFFDCLPFEERMRSHFHRFMHGIHEELQRMNHLQHPLDHLAERLARKTRIICFDEFFVSDIADAMILGTLFDGLFRRGVTLVATSNLPPESLYENGLQRQRFLPTIDLLQEHCDVIELDNGVDYRLRVLEKAEIYHSPLDDVADLNLRQYFDAIAPDEGRNEVPLEISHRRIPTRRLADGVAWFDFEAICAGPRGQADYIEISRCYHTVLVSGVPRFSEYQENEARRFVAMVDEFYDHGVKLILSAAVPLNDLYRGKRLEFEFQRTRSRLEEMQSREYLAREHLP